ncbi:MAG: U32 family peptidase [Polyangiales bacterium]
MPPALRPRDRRRAARPRAHAHLLSPEDLEASSIVPELAKLGIASLKIEGRLKGPEYVDAAVRLYREGPRRHRRGRPASDATAPRRAAIVLAWLGPGFFPGVDHPAPRRRSLVRSPRPRARHLGRGRQTP